MHRYLMTKFIVIAAALLLAVPAPAADGGPLPPKDVFKYAVGDSGDAIEIDWAIDPGAYMYRDEFAFEIENGAIELGAPELPDGQLHSDEFFGEQVVYRDNFFIRIPYTYKGSKPESVELTIGSRGCLDSGYCYMPQSWTETVRLMPLVAGTPKLQLGQPAGTTGLVGANNEFAPVDEVFFPDVFPIDGNTVELGIRIVPGYYLYKDKITVRSLAMTPAPASRTCRKAR
mgnify:CR=1 FL=1